MRQEMKGIWSDGKERVCSDCTGKGHSVGSNLSYSDPNSHWGIVPAHSPKGIVLSLDENDPDWGWSGHSIQDETKPVPKRGKLVLHMIGRLYFCYVWCQSQLCIPPPHIQNWDCILLDHKVLFTALLFVYTESSASHFWKQQLRYNPCSTVPFPEEPLEGLFLTARWLDAVDYCIGKNST